MSNDFKVLQRAVFHERLQQFSDRSIENDRISRQLQSEYPPRKELTVLAYRAMDEEVDVGAYLEALFHAGARVAFPRISGKTLEFRIALGPHGPWQRHKWGFDEPSLECPLWTFDSQRPHIILVPGLAFTPDGLRLGRGGGYYDHFLPTLPPEIVKIGLGYSVQKAKTLHTEGHDFSLDRVVFGI